MNTRVARLRESDWRLFAGMRLRALIESLGEHDPNYREEAAFTAAQWRRRLAHGPATGRPRQRRGARRV